MSQVPGLGHVIFYRPPGRYPTLFHLFFPRAWCCSWSRSPARNASREFEHVTHLSGIGHRPHSRGCTIHRNTRVGVSSARYNKFMTNTEPALYHTIPQKLFKSRHCKYGQGWHRCWEARRSPGLDTAGSCSCVPLRLHPQTEYVTYLKKFKKYVTKLKKVLV